MSKGIVMGTVLVLMVLTIVGCSGNSAQSDEPIKATWVTVRVVDGTASIPASEVRNSRMTHFMLGTSGGDIAFMAYELGGDVHVRSNVCPPCRSIGFSLQRDILVCDTCRTTFKAKTGNGIEGACVDFPKEAVPYEITDGNIVMKGNDLLAAYEKTLNPGEPNRPPLIILATQT